MAIKVTFKTTRGRLWIAIFDLGSDEANGMKILDVTWKHNASIVKSEYTEIAA